MRILGENAILGYCTNVHPGTSPEDIIRIIKTDCLKVKEKIDSSIHFEIGLWLSAKTVQGFKQRSHLEKLKNVCEETQIQVFSWNAFPYSDFHQTQVKAEVYIPNWSEPSRLHYTLDLLELIQNLAFDLPEISISTVPIGYREDRLTHDQIKRSASHLVDFVKASIRLEQEKNIRVHLALEPEPFCYLEKSEDVVLFFKDFLLPLGVYRLKKEMNLSQSEAETHLLNKIRVCYDTCHAAVVFEKPQDILNNYEAVGIKVGKVQISSALVYYPNKLHGREKSSSLSLLNQLSSDRYLHQVVGMGLDNQLEAFTDLSEALLKWKYQKNLLNEYRIHYHIPIFLKKFNTLSTTQNHIQELIELAKHRKITSHWEVETYTWPTLPQNEKKGEISDWIAEEMNWLNQVIQESHDESR